MVSVVLLASIGIPVFIMLIVLLILVMGSRSSISKLRNDVDINSEEVNRMKIDVEEEVNRMKIDVDINSEAVDLMIPWIESAQKTFTLPGFGDY